MHTVLTIGHLTLIEAYRRRVVLAGLASALGFVLCFATGFWFIVGSLDDVDTTWQRLQNQAGLHAMTIAGLYVANFLTLAAAVLLPVDTLSGEITSGVAQTLASKPIRRAEIVAGKWGAYWLLVSLFLIVTAGGVVAAARAIGGFALPNVERAFPLMMLGATVMLTVSIAGGTRLGTVANGLVAFGVFGVAFIGGWVEQIGLAVATNDGARIAVRNIGTVASLLSPTDAMWRLASFEMLPPVARGMPGPPFATMMPPSAMMVVWAVAYVVVLLLIALRLYHRRAL